jgi:hypothetical protein
MEEVQLNVVVDCGGNEVLEVPSSWSPIPIFGTEITGNRKLESVIKTRFSRDDFTKMMYYIQYSTTRHLWGRGCQKSVTFGRIVVANLLKDGKSPRI